MFQNSANFKVTKSTLTISFATQFLQYGVNIFILPIILSNFKSETLAIWYIFLSIQSFAHLLDFGLSPCFSRSFSFVFGGAPTLTKDGFVKSDGSDINYNLLYGMLKLTRKSYMTISLVMLSILLVFGSVYLSYTLKENFDFKLIVYWILFAMAVAFTYYVNNFLIIVKGKGLITLNNFIMLSSKIVYLVTLIVCIYLDFGLLSLIIAMTLSILVQWILGEKLYLSNEERSRLESVDKENVNDVDFNVIWNNAKKQGITSVGVFLFSQSGVFIASLYLTLAEVAQVGLVIQLFSILMVVSRVVLTTFTPRFSACWVNNDLASIRKYFALSQIAGYIIFFSGLAVLIFGGDLILQFIHSKTFLPNTLTISLYACFYFMEITHGNCSSLISTKNEVPFYKAALVAGLISILATLVFIQIGLGMYSLPLGLVCGSLPYNSWKWPVVVYNELYKNRL